MDAGSVEISPHQQVVYVRYIDIWPRYTTDYMKNLFIHSLWLYNIVKYTQVVYHIYIAGTYVRNM